MRSHRNAKTNVYQRRLLIRRVRQQGWTQRQAAEALGVSVRTVAKWLARDRRALGRSLVPPAPTAATRLAAPPEAAIVALRRTRATAWQISAALRRAALDGHARLGARRPESRGAGRAARRRCSATSGRTSAICSMSISNGSAASSGIGHRIHGDRRRRAGRSAGSFSMSPSMMRRGSPMPRCSPADDAPACAAFLRRTLAWFRRRGVRSVGCSPTTRWPIARAPSRRLPRVGRPPPLHPALSSADQRQGRALHSDAAARMGLPRAVPQLRRAAPPRFGPYLRFYNHRRPHASLGRRSPWMRFQEAA